MKRLLFVLLLARTALGLTTNVWIGPTNNAAWTDPICWSDANVPTLDHLVVFGTNAVAGVIGSNTTCRINSSGISAGGLLTSNYTGNILFVSGGTAHQITGDWNLVSGTISLSNTTITTKAARFNYNAVFALANTDNTIVFGADCVLSNQTSGSAGFGATAIISNSTLTVKGASVTSDIVLWRKLVVNNGTMTWGNTFREFVIGSLGYNNNTFTFTTEPNRLSGTGTVDDVYIKLDGTVALTQDWSSVAQNIVTRNAAVFATQNGGSINRSVILITNATFNLGGTLSWGGFTTGQKGPTIILSNTTATLTCGIGSYGGSGAYLQGFIITDSTIYSGRISDNGFTNTNGAWRITSPTSTVVVTRSAITCAGGFENTFFSIADNSTVTFDGSSVLVSNTDINTTMSFTFGNGPTTFTNDSSFTFKSLAVGISAGSLTFCAPSGRMNRLRFGQAMNPRLTNNLAVDDLRLLDTNTQFHTRGYSVTTTNLTFAGMLVASNSAFNIAGGFFKIAGGVFSQQTSTVTFNGDSTCSVTNLYNVALTAGKTLSLVNATHGWSGTLTTETTGPPCSVTALSGNPTVVVSNSGRLNLFLNDVSMLSTGTIEMIGGGLLGAASINAGNGVWLDGPIFVASNALLRATNSTSRIGNTRTAIVTSVGSLVFSNLVIGNSSGRLTLSNGVATTDSISVAPVTSGAGTLSIDGGALACRRELVLGRFGCDSMASLQLSAGTLSVTNDTQTAVLDIRSGSLVMTGGTLIVDRLVLTNSCGAFLRSGGQLILKSAPLLAPDSDADGDGLPNSWEQTYGLDPLASDGDNGANGDPDSDGQLNSQEYLAGTNPSADIKSITKEGDNIRIIWSAFAGKSNALQSAGNGSYSNDFSDTFSVAPMSTSFTNYVDTGAASVTGRYYRIRLAP